MKIKFLMIMAILAGFAAKSQLVITPQLPPLGLMIKPQLWNVAVVNPHSDEIEARIEMVMTDLSTNQRVLTGTTRMFIIPRGTRQLRAADVMPIIYNTGNSGHAIGAGPDGLLPTGVFSICYTVLVPSHGSAMMALAENCETVEIEPISPPQLIIPADNETVEISRPLFTWIPPAPVNNFSQLRYDWALVEVRATQSPADAIQQNIPLLTRQHIMYTSFQYPMSMAELDTGKLYAWRVTAKNNLSTVANSEVWSFRVSKNKQAVDAETENGYYSRLSKAEDAAYFVCKGVLRFEFNNEYNSNIVNLKLYDISTANRREVSLDSSALSIKPGQNLLQLDLRDQGGIVNKHMYLLELTDFKNEKWYLKFEFKK